MVLRPYKQNHHLDEGSSLPARWTPLPPTRYRSYSPRWSQAHLAFTPLSLASVSPRVLGFLLLRDPLWFSIISNCQGLQENHVTQQFCFFFFSSASGFAWFWPVFYNQVCSRSVTEGCNLTLLFKHSAHRIPCRLIQTCTSHCGWPGCGVTVRQTWSNNNDELGIKQNILHLRKCYKMSKSLEG